MNVLAGETEGRDLLASTVWGFLSFSFWWLMVGLDIKKFFVVVSWEQELSWGKGDFERVLVFDERFGEIDEEI